MSEETTIGYVYILENDSMPGLIKIGKTSRDSIERARELSATTGVPTPFKVAFKLLSEEYEKLEREMHSRLADYRVASNREFFKYPVDRAINLLKKLDAEKQNEIGPEDLSNKKNLITRVSDFFKQFLGPGTKPEKPNKTKRDDREPTEIETARESIESTPPAKLSKPSIDYIIKDRPLQNEYRENTVEPSLNGKSYYSEANGFYWAANHQGIAECVPQHIKRIIHNEELEIASTRDELEQEINYLREEVVELEEQRHECEQEIKARSEEFGKNKEKLAGLKVQLKPLTVNGSETLPTEEASDDSNPELFNTTTAEDISDNPVAKQFEEEINDLRREKQTYEQAIEEKSQALAGKKEELAGLEVELRGPTETELNAPETTYQVIVNKKFSWLSRIPSGLVALIATIVLIALSAYLFIFYASAVDKAFFLNEEAIQKQVDEGTYAGIQDIVNPAALSKTFQNRNYFVLFFPCIFLGFALALDHFWESGKRGWVIGLAALTFVFDFLLAIHISLKIYLAEKYIADRTSQEIGEWTLLSRNNILNVSTVIFCGFVASLLVSVLYKVTRERWQKVQSPRPQSKENQMYDMHIKAEKMQREARIAILNTEIENLQNEIEQLKEKNKTTQQKIIKNVRTPIDSQIAVLKVQTDNLESTIKQLNNIATTFEQKIDKKLARIEEASNHLNKRVVNRNKMESQVNQFLNGWCRFVAHSGNGISDVSDQIDRIKQIADDTLDHYYQGSPDYSS